jgi:GTPase SAR1 family protein
MLLVYDVTNVQSFQNIEDWLKYVEEHTNSTVIKILIGAPNPLSDRAGYEREIAAELGSPNTRSVELFLSSQTGREG